MTAKDGLFFLSHHMVMEQQAGVQRKIIRRSRYKLQSLEIAREEDVQITFSMGKGLQKGF